MTLRALLASRPQGVLEGLEGLAWRTCPWPPQQCSGAVYARLEPPQRCAYPEGHQGACEA